jgi:hypothetical protein
MKRIEEHASRTRTISSNAIAGAQVLNIVDKRGALHVKLSGAPGIP